MTLMIPISRPSVYVYWRSGILRGSLDAHLDSIGCNAIRQRLEFLDRSLAVGF